MTIRCVSCRRSIAIPEERVANPRLKVRCTCGALFPLAGAPRVEPWEAETAPIATAEMSSSSVPGQDSALRSEAVLAPAADAPAEAPPGGVAGAAKPRGRGWRWCQTHPMVQSESVCPKCGVGHCPQCTQKVQNIPICPNCEGLCVPASKHEEEEAAARQRARPLKDEIGTILTYPLSDSLAYVMLAVFTWFFGLLSRLATFGGVFGILLSQGVLMWYCFHALTRVANGRLKGYMPDFGDIYDLVRPLRLAAAALLISWGPLLVLMIAVPSLAFAGSFWTSQGASSPKTSQSAPAPPPDLAGENVQEPVLSAKPDPAGEASQASGQGGWAERLGLAQTAAGLVGVFAFAVLWKIAYTPVALTVAGLSQSVLSTLNPAIGIDTIRRMGSVYWQAMLIYTVLSVAQWFFGVILNLVPFLGGLLRSFVDAYAYLAVACTLGLAVFKKGRELGWD